jgi:hypothetical protein
MKKEVEVKIPDYISIGKYQQMNKLESLSELDRIVKVISVVTGMEAKEVRTWDMDSLQIVSSAVGEIVERKGEFHAVLEFGDQLYGYSNLSSFTLGEYIDLEEYLKDPTVNLHKIAALLYRPVTKHNFDKISFLVKNSIKIANNKVENVFDHYKIEAYDNEEVAKRQEMFKQFPVHIVLGAMAFFFAVGSQYLKSIASSETEMIDPKGTEMVNKALDHLLANIGAGGGLYTHSPSLTYFQFPVTEPSLS